MASPSKRNTTTTTTRPRRQGTSRRSKPTHEAIAKRAHEIFVAERGGDPVDHWLRAERELSKQ